MATYFSRETLSGLIGSVDIVEVINRYVPLKKTGRNYTARCPFHKEKTPSFTVSPEERFYYCFGCGAHGDVIRFVMEITGKGFVETVKELSREAGWEIKVTDIQTITSNVEDNIEDYQKNLLASAQVISWIKSKGINEETIRQLRMGYSTTGRFKECIIFPNQNAGLIGHSMENGETVGNGWYGFTDSIRKKRTALVVNNCLDAARLYQHGITHVAVLANIYSVRHLLRISDRIIFCLDKTQENSFPLAPLFSSFEDGKEIKFLFEPIDNILTDLSSLNRAELFSDYFLRRVSRGLDLHTSQERVDLLKRAFSLLDSANNAPSFAFLLRKEIAIKAKIPFLKNFLSQKQKIDPLTRCLLQCLLDKPSLIKEVPLEWCRESPVVHYLYKIAFQQGFQVSTGFLLEELRGTIYEDVITSLHGETFYWNEDFDVEAEFRGLLDRFNEKKIARKLFVLRTEAAKGNAESRQEYLRLLRSRHG